MIRCWLTCSIQLRRPTSFCTTWTAHFVSTSLSKLKPCIHSPMIRTKVQHTWGVWCCKWQGRWTQNEIDTAFHSHGTGKRPSAAGKWCSSSLAIVSPKAFARASIWSPRFPTWSCKLKSLPRIVCRPSLHAPRIATCTCSRKALKSSALYPAWGA